PVPTLRHNSVATATSGQLQLSCASAGVPVIGLSTARALKSVRVIERAGSSVPGGGGGGGGGGGALMPVRSIDRAGSSVGEGGAEGAGAGAATLPDPALAMVSVTVPFFTVTRVSPTTMADPVVAYTR